MTSQQKNLLSYDGGGIVDGDIFTAASYTTALTDILDLIKEGRVRSTSADAYVKHIEDVLQGGSGISISKNNAGGNETLTVAESLQHATAPVVDPAAGDDNVDGYEVGSMWLNGSSDNVFLCVDASTGAAVWREITPTTAASQLSDFTDVSSTVTTANQVLATPDGATGDLSTRALVDGDLPFSAWQTNIMYHYDMHVISGNAMTRTVYTSQFLNHTARQTGASNGDQFSNAVWLKAGNYDFKAIGMTTSDSGILDWEIKPEGGAFSSITTGQDWYSASTTYNVTKTASSLSVANSGYHVIQGTVNGKNASSSSHTIYLTAYWFQPTGGY